MISIIVLILAEHSCTGSKPATPPDLSKAVATIRTSDDGHQLAKAAFEICAMDARGLFGALELLVEQLHDAKFLAKLDPELHYKHQFMLRVPFVLNAIAKAGTPQAERAILKLSKSDVFMANPDRRYSLIAACSWIRRPTPELVAFLQSQAQPNSEHFDLAMRTLIRLATPESLALVERSVHAKEIDIDLRKYWFIGAALPMRTDPNIGQFYKRLFKTDVKNAALRNVIVQTLYEYRGVEWYADLAVFMERPSWCNATDTVLKEVLEMSDIALKLDITSDTKEGVQKARGEIVRIIEQRRSGRE